MKSWIFVCWIVLLTASVPVQALEEKDLQKFIDEAIKAGGGEVVIPPGEFIISKGLVVRDAKNINIAGMDKERSVLKCDPAFEGSVFTLAGTAEKLTIQKLTIDGANSGKAKAIQTEGGEKAVYKQVSIQDCLLQNQLQSGISLSTASEINVQRCSFADIKGTALNMKETSKAEISGNWITRCDIGLNLEDCSETKVIANEVTECEKAFVSKGKSGEGGVTIQDNTFQSGEK